MNLTLVAGSLASLVSVVVGAELGRRGSQQTNAANILMQTRIQVYCEYLTALNLFRKVRLDRWNSIQEGRETDVVRFESYAAKAEIYASLAKVQLVSHDPSVATVAEAAFKSTDQVKNATPETLAAILDRAKVDLGEFVRVAGRNVAAQ